ncbi:MAG: glycosyltransferase 4 family protein [candidate division WOR-3 bacterium]
MNIETIIFIPVLLFSFFITLLLIPVWIRHAKKINLLGKDMHKMNSELIPEAGGVVVLAGIFSGIFYYTLIKICVYHTYKNVITTFGLVITILFVAIIGILDDTVGGWKKGLRQWQKPLLTIPAAIPFLLVNFHRTTIDLPILGLKDVGLLYPLLLIPAGIVGSANAFNMLAGYNGLEAGMGVIILGVISLLSFLSHQYFAVMLSLIGISALIAFLFYNWYPAKIFPGDTLTYSIGAYIAICAILGGVEKYALFLFIPYFLDFFLPLRKGLQVEAFARVNKDGSIEQPYNQIFDTAHLVIFLLKKIKKRVYETDVVLIILGFEFILGLICVIVRLNAS